MRCNHAAACKVFFAKLISAEFWNVQIYGQWVFNSNPKRMAKSMHPTHGRLIALPLILITWDGLTLSRSSRGVPARSAWWSVVGMQWELNISKGVRNLSKACAERTAESQWLTGHVHAFAGAFCGLLTFSNRKRIHGHRVATSPLQNGLENRINRRTEMIDVVSKSIQTKHIERRLLLLISLIDLFVQVGMEVFALRVIIRWFVEGWCW